MSVEQSTNTPVIDLAGQMTQIGLVEPADLQEFALTGQDGLLDLMVISDLLTGDQQQVELLKLLVDVSYIEAQGMKPWQGFLAVGKQIRERMGPEYSEKLKQTIVSSPQFSPDIQGENQ